ncbi:hypothetical protein ACFX13_017619 [Malus domestica]
MRSLDMLGMYILEPGVVCGIGSLACKEVRVALGLGTFGIMKVPSLGRDILEHRTVCGIGGQFACEEVLVPIGLVSI